MCPVHYRLFCMAGIKFIWKLNIFKNFYYLYALKTRKISIRDKSVIMKKSVFLFMMAAAVAFAACTNSKLNPADEPVFQVVAQPDFVFSSMGNTLYSTKATRATAAPTTKAEEEKPSTGVEVNLSVCPANQYNASKLSVHIRIVNDVTVFIPVEATAFSENDVNSLAILLENASATGVYGETEQTLNVNGNTIKTTVQFVGDGVKVSVTGVNQDVIDYLQEKYGDGITVEVWNYYRNTTLDALKAGFDAGAKVSFSEKPSLYVNAFAKVPDYVETLGDVKIYTKYVEVSSSERYYEALGEDKSFLYPYKDETFTQPLDAQYWVRPARYYADGDEKFVGPSKYYLLKGHKNAYDCTVTPEGVTFDHQEANDATIPADVESKVYDIPANYNVLYY